MKTEGMTQQIEGLAFLDGKRYGALFMEQGTGKTWTFLADAERYYERGKVECLVVLAPNGVHTNWVLREIPVHLYCQHMAVAWPKNLTIKTKQALKKLLQPRQSDGSKPLRILTMNYEALRGPKVRDYLLQFMTSGACMYILDESQNIKNPASGTTKNVMAFREHSVARRIGTGTPMDKPQDIYSQMDFLAPGLLGTTSYRAFMSEYAVLPNWREPKTEADWSMKKQVEKNPRMAHAIIVARDEDTGLPMYKNLDRLNEYVARNSFRVLKADCLGLMPKIYTSRYFELSAKQQAAYELMESEFRIELESGELTPVSKLAALIKLQQITSGYVVVPDQEELMYIGDDNPRIELIGEEVAETEGKIIIWARFREEVRQLASALSTAGRKVVQYHGDIKPKEREEAIDEFQKGEAEIFLGVQKAGGTGLTLTAARKAIYCSNEHSAIVRNQSEDRNHRKGTIGQVTYVDIVAVNTVDEEITKAHQWKTGLAETILKARGLDLRGVL